MKVPLQGLIDMQSIAWHNTEGGEPTFVPMNVGNFPGLFGGVVINATWDTLQPTQGGALVTAQIDDALDDVRAYNRMYPATPIGVKLRVYQGSNAPEWAKEIGGDPVNIIRNPEPCNTPPCPTDALTVGRVWSADYIKAWRAFQRLLAQKYDGEPLVREVAVTSCGTQTDEPFVPTNDATSRNSMIAAGYTDTAQKACLHGAFNDYQLATLTLVDYTFNPFTALVDTDAGTGAAFSESVMTA